jgi:catechol 2,3-dioxygenase-like lactoylglutathione lyase family enzyme
MIDHVSIGVADLEAAGKLYAAALQVLGIAKIVDEPETCGFGKDYPEIWLNHRPARQADMDSGTHICLRTRTIDTVNAFYEVALAAGASCAGEPGFRPEYSEQYYAAFINDLDGNKIEVVTFADPEGFPNE